MSTTPQSRQPSAEGPSSDTTPYRAITVVSGLPRSGTSMMMRMLGAAGMTLLVDNLRKADADNPQGYFEFERVKQLPKGDMGWLEEARGKAVKVISALLEYLPPEYTYKVVFMHRQMGEILASQQKMLTYHGEAPGEASNDTLGELFERHLAKVQAWLSAQPYIALLNVDYNRLIEEPRPYVSRVCRFLGGSLDVEKMVGVVDPTLYRNRGAQDRS